MDEVYNLTVILDEYCDMHLENENISYISPLIKIILNKIDKINNEGIK